MQKGGTSTDEDAKVDARVGGGGGGHFKEGETIIGENRVIPV